MILIVGNSNDDILYFESVLRNKQEIKILNKYTAYSGEIYNQKVMLLKDVYTSYVTSAVISHVIEKYLAILVIAVGTCQAYSNKLKVGNICICKQVVCGDVNCCDVANVRKGEIPGFLQTFLPSNEISNAISNALENSTYSIGIHSSFISVNKHIESAEQLNDISYDESVLGIKDTIVLSSEIGGIAVACQLHDIPFAAINVVGRLADKKSDIEDYIEVLKKYSDVGKAVVSVIGEIGRSDIIR